MPLADIPNALPTQECIELQSKTSAYGFNRGKSYGPLGRLVHFQCDGFGRPAAWFELNSRYGWQELLALVYAGAVVLQAGDKQ